MSTSNFGTRRTSLGERILARVLRAGGYHSAAAKIERELDDAADATRRAQR